MSTPETATLGSRAMATIAAAARIMYPHDALPDAVYARVGERLAEAAREDPWAERAYPKLIYFNEVDRGCHFAAWQEPALFTAEVRAAFRSLR
jgi:hypothetical protein